MRRLALWGAVVVLGATADAAAAASWAVQGTPNPTGAKGSALNGTSCAPSGPCTAVGYFYNSADTQLTLAERWSGTSWVVQGTPNPTGARSSSLSSVSCASASACTAVGSFVTLAHNTATLAERWNGTSWTLQPVPGPGGLKGSSLGGVSCVSANACVAVGGFVNSAGIRVTLAVRWDGTSWKVQGTPNPSGAKGSYLGGVSCSSASACIAVGAFVDKAGTTVTLAERWTGGKWAVQKTQNPSGAKASVLDAVSCTSSTACAAVGAFVNKAGTTVTLAQSWNGTSWKLQSAPNPLGAKASNLAGVSCTSPAECAAVGSFVNGAGTTVTLAEHWNGSSWALQSTPNPAGAKFSSLGDVSCTSPAACEAVGSFINSGNTVTLAEVFAPRWAVQSTPNPPGGKSSPLSGISCPSTTACITVGFFYNSAKTPVTFAEAWNGKVWKLQATPNPPGAKASYLSDVSCTSASTCTAVGYSMNSSGKNVTLVEVWNGKVWKVQSTPNPTGAEDSYLQGVSCTSPNACTAVGWVITSTAILTLAERWDGKSWKVQSTPNPAGAKVNYLVGGVWCTSPTACTAVGFSKKGSATVTLAEHWDGKSWKLQSTPNPTGAKVSNLAGGVSCASPSACIAVGYYAKGSATFALAERWDGKSWKVQSTPNPAGATATVLLGVWCPSSAACTAVGFFSTATTSFGLAEHWNGTTWTRQSTPNPAGATASFLNHVSCTSVSVCTAVGYFQTKTSTQLTLAERYS